MDTLGQMILQSLVILTNKSKKFYLSTLELTLKTGRKKTYIEKRLSWDSLCASKSFNSYKFFPLQSIKY